MSRRYDRNMKTLSPEENRKLRDFRVLVAGCGGLGGYIIEELGRLGIGQITAVDGDVFEESNLNRQLLSTVPLLGTEKAEAARVRMRDVNPEIRVKPIYAMITQENAKELLGGHDLVVDALDNIKSRKVLESACEALEIPMVHGAIAGWYGQVAVSFPGDRIMETLYTGDDNKGIETDLGNPAFTPAVVASIQVAEAIKVLLGRPGILRGKLLTIDLLAHDYEVFSLRPASEPEEADR